MTEKKKKGPVPKSDGQRVKNLTVYRSLNEIIQKGGAVRLRKLIHKFLDELV